MHTFLTFFLFALGLLLIIKGGDWFVDAAAWIARVSGIPQFIIGATIVSVATTLPEIIVSVIAAAEGNITMATGNAIGSVTANTGMILATSIVCLPAVIDRKKYLPKSLIFFIAIILLWALSLSGDLTIIGAAAMLALFVFFIYENVRDARSDMAIERTDEQREDVNRKIIIKNILLFVVGAACIVVGSDLLVDNGTIIAEEILKIDQRIVSLTMVAIGTSLPELVTTITAVIKKQSSLSVGNIIGANIIDMSLILPICAFISGGSLPVEQTTVWIDLPVSLLVALITLLPALFAKRFRRWQGVLSLCIYAMYLVYICVA